MEFEEQKRLLFFDDEERKNMPDDVSRLATSSRPAPQRSARLSAMHWLANNSSDGALDVQQHAMVSVGNTHLRPEIGTNLSFSPIARMIFSKANAAFPVKQASKIDSCITLNWVQRLIASSFSHASIVSSGLSC